jgi:3-hydroxyisobutyrate dehydrogenase-like beta-hydroxyacid dehydrogenase
VLKLAINISLALQTLAFSEGLLLAEREGVEVHLEHLTNNAAAATS